MCAFMCAYACVSKLLLSSTDPGSIWTKLGMMEGGPKAIL